MKYSLRHLFVIITVTEIKQVYEIDMKYINTTFKEYIKHLGNI